MLFSRRRHQPLLRLTTRRNLNLLPGLNSWDHYKRYNGETDFAIKMPRTITQINVFIASPKGLETERKLFRETLNEYTEEIASQGFSFLPVGWEITLGGVG